MVCGIIAYGLARRVNVFDTFVEGAYDGMKSLVNILAPLVGLMAAIAAFRESGLLDIFAYCLKPVTSLINLPSDVLPLALLRPVSGSGSLAILGDIFKTSGPDSLSGKIASVMMGSSETTFYTLAVYFGSVKIKNVRHTVKAALLGDLTVIIASSVAVQMLV